METTTELELAQNKFSIRDLENLTGIKAHTLRIWEQRYQIIVPKRTATNIRYYDATDLKLALQISMLNNYGYKISKIKSMTEENITSLLSKINDPKFKLEAIVNELISYTIDLDTVAIEKTIQSFIDKNGIPQLIEELLFHFLEKIGIMWMTNRLNPAQEHLTSNIITRKIAVAYEQLSTPVSKDSKVLLFLPEGEIHDLALLYVQYLLKAQGVENIYLGANTPIKDAIYVCQVKAPTHVYIHLTSVTDTFDVKRFIEIAHKSFPNAQVLVSGSLLKGKKLKLYKNIQYLFSLSDVKSAIYNNIL